jgi:hypothetical protein
MSDKNNDNSFKEKLYNIYIEHNKNKNEIEAYYLKLLNEEGKNKDILLQVRIDEQYDKMLNILEMTLNKNRSEIIRLAVDNLFEDYFLKKKDVEKLNKKSKEEQLQEETIYILMKLKSIYDSNNIEKYMKAITNNLNFLEEKSKK